MMPSRGLEVRQTEVHRLVCLPFSPAAPLQGSLRKLTGEESGCSRQDLFLDVPASLTYSPSLAMTPRATHTSRQVVLLHPGLLRGTCTLLGGPTGVRSRERGRRGETDGRWLAWGQGGQETWGSADSCGVLPDGLIPQTLPAVLRGSYALAKSVFRNEVSCSGMHTQMLGL